MGILNFSFLTGNKSRPQFKCNLTYIPGFFSGIKFFIPNRNIFLKKNHCVWAKEELSGQVDGLWLPLWLLGGWYIKNNMWRSHLWCLIHVFVLLLLLLLLLLFFLLLPHMDN